MRLLSKYDFENFSKKPLFLSFLDQMVDLWDKVRETKEQMNELNKIISIPEDRFKDHPITK